MSTAAPRILLLAGDLAGNVGDRAIRAAQIAQVRRVAPDAQLFTTSRQPERDRKEFDIGVAASSPPALLFRPGWLRRVDLTIFGGGQLLQDDTSLAKNLHWAVVLQAIRRLSRGPVLGYGLGVGPLLTKPGRRCAAAAVRALSGAVVRDPRSADWVRTFAPAMPVEIAPDPAWTLAPEPFEPVREWVHEIGGWPDPLPGPVLGLALRRFFPPQGGWLPCSWRYRRGEEGKGDAAFSIFMERLADEVRAWAVKHHALVVIFPMYAAAWQNDAREAAAWAARLGDATVVTLPSGMPAARLKALFGLCDLAVGVPMHSAILALGAGTPCVHLAYAEKGCDLYSVNGLKEWLLDARAAPESEAGVGQLARRLDRLWQNPTEARSRLKALNAGWVAGCAAYDRLIERWRNGVAAT